MKSRHTSAPRPESSCGRRTASNAAWARPGGCWTSAASKQSAIATGATAKARDNASEGSRDNDDEEGNMPFAGLGLHLLVAVFFAVHALRSGQNMYWLIILFSFPLLGSIVYFVVVYLPNSRLERGARKAVARAARALDPGRELREARAALDDTPTAQNLMRLAAALLEAGQPDEAVTQYQACLKGPFANDPEIRFGAARALLAAGHPAGAAGHLQFIRGSQPEYRAERVSLLLAECLATAGRSQEARSEYESA